MVFTFATPFLADCIGSLNSFFVAVVLNNNFCPSLGKSFYYGQSNTGTRSRNKDGPALEGKERNSVTVSRRVPIDGGHCGRGIFERGLMVAVDDK